jgi:hypothetical protein
MIEFLLSALVTIFLMFWTVELCLAIYAHNVLSDAAKEGVRYAIVHGTSCVKDGGGTPPTGCNCYGPGDAGLSCDATAAGVYAKILDYGQYSLKDLSTLPTGCSGTGGCIEVQYPDLSSKPRSRVVVIIRYPYVSLFNLGWNGPTLKAGAEGRIVY